MRYTVTWDPAALDELANAWIESSDRQAVNAAAEKIDDSLRLSPQQLGLDMGGDRYAEVPPLAVIFSISADDCLVKVRTVWSLV